MVFPRLKDADAASMSVCSDLLQQLLTLELILKLKGEQKVLDC